MIDFSIFASFEYFSREEPEIKVQRTSKTYWQKNLVVIYENRKFTLNKKFFPQFEGV